MQEAEQGNNRCQGDSSHSPCPLGAPWKKPALWSATGCDIYSHFYRLWVASDPNATWEFLGLISSCRHAWVNIQSQSGLKKCCKSVATGIRMCGNVIMFYNIIDTYNHEFKLQLSVIPNRWFCENFVSFEMYNCAFRSQLCAVRITQLCFKFVIVYSFILIIMPLSPNYVGLWDCCCGVYVFSIDLWS